MAFNAPPFKTPRFLSSLFSSSVASREEMLAGPIRGELLGADHLAERAREVARSAQVATRGKGKRQTPLLGRLNETRHVLEEVHSRLAAAVEREINIGPAGEWLLDNFHVVQEHIREVRESLPRGFYRELPELSAGPLAGYPRVYQLAITLISHTEGRIDLENVNLFVGAFQQSAVLSIGELWAVPAMLRLGLIENVRRMALRTVQRLEEIEQADEWAARIEDATAKGSRGHNQVLDDFVSDHPPLAPAFVSRFLQQLRLMPGALPSLAWLEQWIGDEGLNVEDAAARATQRLALTQIMMANSITSLRAIAGMDWRTFVERQSIVEAVLRRDPSSFYPRMTFATRDKYRHAVERIAKRTGVPEEAVARSALDLAVAGAGDGSADPRQGHVGYYLIDSGLPRLEEVTGLRPTLEETLHRWVLRHPNVIFVGGILAGTLVVLAALLWLAGPAARMAWPLVVALGLLPAGDIAVSLVNQLVTAFLPPRILPKLDLGAHGVPSEFRTAVVIPTLFDGVEAVRAALDNLEAQFLANRESHLHFAVLSDFTDAPSQHQEGDQAIVEAATEGVRALNARYGQGAEDAFYLFHRPRVWNERQGVWMGWERKRGKLAEFNRFLRGGASTAFAVIVGDIRPLQDVRYVITLDADTVLPPDAAPLLIGALAHPLNRAVYDPSLGRVVRGYGIVQPRVGVSLPSAHRSRFAAIHSGHPGVDPYTTAVSDVYQDLYGEGSFTGKGIYDVDAFEQATHGRFPENTLLSHDLIEGSYSRAGLATDISVYDDYPTSYLSYTRRKHRWIRGDWQLLPWLGREVPGPDGPERNRLSLLSRWKIVDNLRRSTVEVAQFVLLVAGWLVLPGSPLRWTVLSLIAVAAPWVVALLLAALQPPFDKSWRAYYSAVGRDAATSAEQVGLALIFLPHQAWISADAILRTLWRLLVSKRFLLEWQTASQTEQGLSHESRQVWQAMAPAVALAAGILALTVAMGVFGRSPEKEVWVWQLSVSMFPLIAIWIASPAIARALSGPAVRLERRVPRSARIAALRYALLHWRYFDRFVSAETSWLVPDNFQEDPAPVVAMRLSPTNLGLQLLTTVSAYDLGFLTVEDMTRRLEQTFQSLERMRRFRGHFYNWYDLRDLRVLEPAYISTVDSGNLAGHLLALRQACLSIPDDPLFDTRVWGALETAFIIGGERLSQLAESARSGPPLARQAVAQAQERLRKGRSVLEELGIESPLPASLQILSDALEGVREALGRFAFAPEEAAAATEWLDWSRSLIHEHHARLGYLRPTPVNGREGEPTNAYPSLRQLEREATTTPGLVARLNVLADRAYDYASEMDFQFLYDPERKLFSIGYQQSSHSLDSSYYDLLASEARLASFVAIAKNDVPVEHWFRLGRMLTRAAGETALVSWSGTMFEYLMPPLIMQSFPFTVLDQTYRGVVERQISYGAERGVPWGVSESSYNLRDRHLTYQYRAFGVPDLGLKRGLGRDLVITPHATAMAAIIDLERSLANLAALERRGALGPYGFRDALDYTRPDPGSRYAIVRNYMAHHAGMSVLALTNALTAQIWQRRFHTDPLVRSAELLLHERIPRRLVLQDVQTVKAEEAMPDPDLERPSVREIDTPDTAQPHVALLGQLPYTIMVSNAGAGYSRYENLAVTRWRADRSQDQTGQFCYLKDVTLGRCWSAAHQPLCAPANWYRALLGTDRVTFHRVDGTIETRTEIAVVPADSAEVRRVTVTNNSEETREIELTSYGEIVMAPPDADRAHPAFSNLFVQTEWHEWCTAITATRRPRSSKEPILWCVHVVDGGKERVGPVSCETDRSRFLGRGRSTRNPVAVEHDGALSGTTGAVLDPIFALRTRVRLDPGQSASVAFTTLVATSRERAFELAGRYHEPHAAQRALDLAWTTAQVELRELVITPAEAGVFQEIAGHLFHGDPALRAPQNELRQNRGSQLLLWANGISGDWPILLAMISSPEGLPTLRQLFVAHHYWRRRGMMVDLVVLNAQAHDYQQELGDRIIEALLASSDSGFADKPGGVFVRRKDLLRPDELLMLRATARVHVDCDGRPLGRILDSKLNLAPRAEEIDAPQLLRMAGRSAVRAISRIWTDTASTGAAERALPQRPSGPPARPPLKPGQPRAQSPLLFDNGYGGLTPEGAYEIRVQGDFVPPAPWVNVIANPVGGFIVSERGAGVSWAANSQSYRLTPWSNDPVSDPVGDVIYLRDQESGDLWTPTPAPIFPGEPYTVRHGAGFSTFEHEHGGIVTHLTLGLTGDAMVKVSMLRVTNRDSRPRTLVMTAYVEWTLGILREHTRHQVRTEFDPQSGAIFAQNFYDPQFAGYVAFCALSETVSAHTADRGEFLGTNGTLTDPAALRNGSLSGTTGAGIDPCAALQCAIHLGPGETREVAVLLGAGVDEAQARALVVQYRGPQNAGQGLGRTVAQWEQRLSTITVRTPEPSFDVMMNRWILYQALACRMWGRTGLYQSSGAYGFRDQLQDVMAFVYAEPALAREHIIRSAGRQFAEGDVQHWWHPPTGRGVRTRFSDDLVWLPYVVDHYVRVTGDVAVFEERAPYLAMRQLEPHEEELYEVPQLSHEEGSVYEHCVRAIKKACTEGSHGLPLIGIGDWNDGMNRVGVEGRGESIWLAWFLVTTLHAFAKHAEDRGDTDTAAKFLTQAKAYAAAVEANGWDGEWYRRAYFDDGTPLGSASRDECRIDSIAQSWAVISGAAPPERQSQAMQSLRRHLVNQDARLIMLLTPPFDRMAEDPGYIKGYLPGVRENGAQYTHAALWAVLATALRGDANGAFELFQMINPLTHASSDKQVQTYKVEPYVVAADVYTAEGQVGRGGWTWYTGSASWMYRVGIETILGFTKRGNSLSVTPRVPTSWAEYGIDYRFGESIYSITVRPAGVRDGMFEVSVDGSVVDGSAIPLVDDGERHEVLMKAATSPARGPLQPELDLGI